MELGAQDSTLASWATEASHGSAGSNLGGWVSPAVRARQVGEEGRMRQGGRGFPQYRSCRVQQERGREMCGLLFLLNHPFIKLFPAWPS